MFLECLPEYDLGIAAYTHCNAVQHTATHCNTLQHTATHCSRRFMNALLQVLLWHSERMNYVCTWCVLQHTATNCNTLQHTATHCNTVQQTFHECLTWSFAMAFWTNAWCVHIMCATVMMCAHDVCYGDDVCTWRVLRWWCVHMTCAIMCAMTFRNVVLWWRVHIMCAIICAMGWLRLEAPSNYRSLFQKSPIKETIFCKRDV